MCFSAFQLYNLRINKFSSLFTYKTKIKILNSNHFFCFLTFSSFSFFFLSLHFPFHIPKFSFCEFHQTLFLRFWFQFWFWRKRIKVLCYDVVFGRSKSEKNEATPTPSRAHVVGGGGEGVCAVTETSKEDECAADDGANEIAFFFAGVFSWWWCKRSGLETKRMR